MGEIISTINSGRVNDHWRTFHLPICRYKIRFKSAYETTILPVRALRQLLHGTHSKTRAIYLKTKCRGEYFSKAPEPNLRGHFATLTGEISVVQGVTVEKKEPILTTSPKMKRLSFFMRVRKIAKATPGICLTVHRKYM